MSGQTTSPSVWDANRLRIATDAAGVALWSWNVDTDEIALDERAHGLWGVVGEGDLLLRPPPAAHSSQPPA